MNLSDIDEMPPSAFNSVIMDRNVFNEVFIINKALQK